MKESQNNFYPILSTIKSPKDLKKIEDAGPLCREIRKKLIEVTSKNGGHLSSNLGVVELTAALYKVFDAPEDKIIWDVGHQSYVHKMLTGRFEKIDGIRKEGGISGFTNRKESPYDVFTSGHSSTSISSALGLAQSKKILGQSGSVVAVIGDGALTGGLAYEGLNNICKLKNFILVLNDNHMSISKNVGAVARYLTAARLDKTYRKAKNILSNILEKTPLGLKVEGFLRHSKSTLKSIIYRDNIFEKMGFEYYGPVDGHNTAQLEIAFNIAKNINKPVVIHVVTSKGKGYSFAEKDPKNFHGVAPFDIATGGAENKKGETFSSVFGSELCRIAEENKSICAITAAMTSGTGLAEFKEKFKKRFFDVGIAEGHAVTFASGLSVGGLSPVFAVYSSFLQRSYDQLVHDASMQGTKMILAIDRAGLVGQDGEAHQGIFDVAFLSTIPNVVIYCPSFFEELRAMLRIAVASKEKKIYAIRYPKGVEGLMPSGYEYKGADFEFFGDQSSDTLIITYGRLFSQAYEAMQKLEVLGKKVCILKMNVIKPISSDFPLEKCLRFGRILFFEEASRSGAVGEKFGSMISGKFKGVYEVHAINDTFVPHASVKRQFEWYGLDSESIKNIVFN